MLQYVVFKTRWGYFGLVGTEQVLCRTFLPVADRQQAEQRLLQRLRPTNDNHRPDKDFQRNLQERIIAYYEGDPADFRTEPAVSLNGSGPFVQKVLRACRKIAFGRTTTYSGLAKQVGNPNAARAVGSALASNPIPLIIPCHRVHVRCCAPPRRPLRNGVKTRLGPWPHSAHPSFSTPKRPISLQQRSCTPCHRVLRTDGGLGGFSAPGGIDIKQKMLRHEQAARL